MLYHYPGVAVHGVETEAAAERTRKMALKSPFSGAFSRVRDIHAVSPFFIVESFEREKDIVATINRKLYTCVARARFSRELSRCSERESQSLHLRLGLEVQ